MIKLIYEHVLEKKKEDLTHVIMNVRSGIAEIWPPHNPVNIRLRIQTLSISWVTIVTS